MPAPTGPDFETALAVYHDAVEQYLRTPPGRLREPGTTVHPHTERDESGVASAYRIAVSTTIRCATRHAELLSELAGSTSVQLDEFDRWCEAGGAELVGGAFMHLLSETRPAEAPIPTGGRIRRIDRENTDDVAAVRSFVDLVGPEAADEAELDPADLDPTAVLLMDSDDRAAAFASWREWADDPRFGDIGVVTGAEHRRVGWGRAAVAIVIHSAFERGIIPLYRCNDDNIGSRRLAESLGYRPIARLRAWRLPD